MPPPAPRSPPCPQASRGAPLPSTSGEPGGPGARGAAFEAAVVCSGRLSRGAARGPAWTLSESSREAKNRGIRLGRECCRPVSLATPGSGPRPSCSWAGGQGRGPTHQGPRAAQPHPSPPARSALGLGGLGPRDWYMGPGRAGATPVQVPTGHCEPGPLGLCDPPEGPAPSGGTGLLAGRLRGSRPCVAWWELRLAGAVGSAAREDEACPWLSVSARGAGTPVRGSGPGTCGGAGAEPGKGPGPHPGLLTQPGAALTTSTASRNAGGTGTPAALGVALLSPLADAHTSSTPCPTLPAFLSAMPSASPDRPPL